MKKKIGNANANTMEGIWMYILLWIFYVTLPEQVQGKLLTTLNYVEDVDYHLYNVLILAFSLS